MIGRQLSLGDVLRHPKMGANARLDGIDAAIDWGPLRGLAEGLRAPSSTGAGRPPYDELAMLKALYLQQLYDLSDNDLEEALGDRLSFRRFCGFVAEDGVPDATTIVRFRQLATAKGLLEAAFAEVNRQLERKDFILRRGTLIDATLVQAASRRPSGKDQPAGVRLAREPGASWTKKNGRSHFGYRLHLGVDMTHILVRRVAFAPAHVAESNVAEALIAGDEAAVYADKGYESKARRARLRAAKIKDRVMHRSHKHQAKLPHWQERRNALIARLRAPVESVFGTMKRVFGYGRARYTGFAANYADAFRVATVFNLRRAASLAAP